MAAAECLFSRPLAVDPAQVVVGDQVDLSAGSLTSEPYWVTVTGFLAACDEDPESVTVCDGDCVVVVTLAQVEAGDPAALHVRADEGVLVRVPGIGSAQDEDGWA